MKKSMAMSEKAETPKIESEHHPASFLRKALTDKKSLKGKTKSFSKGK
jgi:hypothetical protein